MSNVPDDWALYYSICGECGDITHASEGHACSCDDEEDRYITVRYSVCSRSGDVKQTEIYRNQFGGVETEVTTYRYGDMAGNLTENQRRWRESLMIRLAHASAS